MFTECKHTQIPVFAFAKDGCTTTCMVITPFGSSPKGTLHWPTVLLFSKIFPAFISLMSFAALGAIFLSMTNQKVSFCYYKNTIKNQKQKLHWQTCSPKSMINHKPKQRNLKSEFAEGKLDNALQMQKETHKTNNPPSLPLCIPHFFFLFLFGMNNINQNRIMQGKETQQCLSRFQNIRPALINGVITLVLSKCFQLYYFSVSKHFFFCNQEFKGHFFPI